MDRRLFISKSVAGFALTLLPLSLTAGSRPANSAKGQGDLFQTFPEVAGAIQAGLIGSVEQLTITHVYSPEQTSLSALLTLAQQDFALASRLTGLPFSVDAQTLFVDSPSAAFGSYAASFTMNNIAVTWQGMARIGGQPSAPSGTVRLSGSAGVLQLNTSETVCQILDLTGRALPAQTTPSFLI